MPALHSSISLLTLLLSEVFLFTRVSSLCFSRRWWRLPRRWELPCRSGRACSGLSLLKSLNPSSELLHQGNPPALSSPWALTRPWVKPCPRLLGMGKACSFHQVPLLCTSAKWNCGRGEASVPLGVELQRVFRRIFTRLQSSIQIYSALEDLG